MGTIQYNTISFI